MIRLPVDERSELALKKALLMSAGHVYFRRTPIFLDGFIEADENLLVVLLRFIDPLMLDEVSRVRLRKRLHLALEKQFSKETTTRRLQSLMNAIIELEQMKISDIGSYASSRQSEAAPRA